ncbi:hypothetical protein ABT160_11210 [Streptomyces sp. NPDC001941]|uniref:hypothetical protein n=1 Tax=Streptomyces sp. NPDC001941 TaxID=3154659 RepID=UPI0033252211
MGEVPRHRARTTPRTAAAAAALACLAAALTGCSGGAAEGGGASASPRASTPADICTSLVSYWAREALTGGKWAGIDWEQKGLSNGQLVIHDRVLAAARAEEKAHGRDAALKLIDRETRRACRDQNGATWSTDNWKPPSPRPNDTGPATSPGSTPAPGGTPAPATSPGTTHGPATSPGGTPEPVAS